MSDSKIIELLKEACAVERGVLTIIRLDNYELLRDIYGESVGKQIREECRRIIDSFSEAEDIKACLGSEEFVVFYNNVKSRIELTEIYFHLVKAINEIIAEAAEQEYSVYTGVSMGAVMVPEQGNDYEMLFAKADRALDYVKETGGKNVAFYDFCDIDDMDVKEMSIDELSSAASSMPDENESDCGAMWVEESEYRTIHNFLDKFNDTYNSFACEIDITFNFDKDMDNKVFDEIMMVCGGKVNHTLRKSDIMTRSGYTLHLLLPEMTHQYMPGVLSRIKSGLKSVHYGDAVNIAIDSKIIGSENESPVSYNLAV